MTIIGDSTVEVTPLCDAAAWSRYVDASPAASIYHQLAWKTVIETAFHHRCWYLIASERGKTIGILPLVEMNSVLFGHSLVSLPFCSYGGIVATGAGSEIVLANAACALAMRVGADEIQLRQTRRATIPWSVREHKVSMVVTLPTRIDEYWAALSSRLRGKIRKASRGGAVLRVTGGDGLDRFYEVFARNMRDLGTPVYPRRFFKAIFESFAGSAAMFIVDLGGCAVAAALGFRTRENHLELPWICSNYAYSTQYVNEFLYWSVLEWACAQGVRTVDLGRSSVNSGSYLFKRQWKADEHQLYWYCWARDGKRASDLSPTNPKYSMAIRMWQKLPLPVANRLGPLIVRNLP